MAPPLGVRVGRPPQHSLSAGLVKGAGAARQSKTHVDGRQPPGNVGVGAVEYAAFLFILVEAEQDERFQRVPRLRNPLHDRVMDSSRNRVWRPLIVSGFKAVERSNITHGGKANTQ